MMNVSPEDLEHIAESFATQCSAKGETALTFAVDFTEKYKPSAVDGQEWRADGHAFLLDTIELYRILEPESSIHVHMHRTFKDYFRRAYEQLCEYRRTTNETN
jgi:hypothetical protein